MQSLALIYLIYYQISIQFLEHSCLHIAAAILSVNCTAEIVLNLSTDDQESLLAFKSRITSELETYWPGIGVLMLPFATGLVFHVELTTTE